MTKLPAKGTEDIVDHNSAGRTLLRRRVERLFLLIEQDAPDILIRNERRLIKDALSALGTSVNTQNHSSDVRHFAECTYGNHPHHAPITRDRAEVALLAGAEDHVDLERSSLLH